MTMVMTFRRLKYMCKHTSFLTLKSGEISCKNEYLKKLLKCFKSEKKKPTHKHAYFLCLQMKDVSDNLNTYDY